MTEEVTTGPDHRAEDNDPETAAEQSVDPDRLLGGEDPTTNILEDAEHWQSVYRELVTFKEDLVERTAQTMVKMQPDAANEVQSTDLTVLGAEAERLGRRLLFWQRRVEDLTN